MDKSLKQILLIGCLTTLCALCGTYRIAYKITYKINEKIGHRLKYGNPSSVRYFDESSLRPYGDVVTPFGEITKEDSEYVLFWIGKENPPFDFMNRDGRITEDDVVYLLLNQGKSSNDEGPTQGIEIVFAKLIYDFGLYLSEDDQLSEDNRALNQSYGNCQNFASFAHCRLRGPRYSSSFGAVLWEECDELTGHAVLKVTDKKTGDEYLLDDLNLFLKPLKLEKSIAETLRDHKRFQETTFLLYMPYEFTRDPCIGDVEDMVPFAINNPEKITYIINPFNKNLKYYRH